MATLANTLAPLLADPAVTSRISRQLGVDEQTTQQAVAVALPLVVAALARNTATPQGAQSLDRALARDHDGSVLTRLPDAVANYDAGPGDGILRHVLGEQRQNVETTFSRTAGVDGAALLKMLAPVVLGALGNMKREQGLDAGALASTLQREQQQMGRSSGDVASVVSALLDSNEDGSVVDDVVGLAGRLFRR